MSTKKIDKLLIAVEREIDKFTDTLHLNSLKAKTEFLGKIKVLYGNDSLKEQSKSGMYDEREKITIGKYTVAAMSDNPDDGVWIQDNEADDGGQFKGEKLFNMIDDFYRANF